MINSTLPEPSIRISPTLDTVESGLEKPQIYAFFQPTNQRICKP
jgi:hypothetical protein